MNNLHIIILETSSSSSSIEFVEKIVNIITGLLVAFGSVGGIVFLKKLKEKRLNATFGYFSRLKVRIHFLSTTFKAYNDILLDRLIPVQNRRAIDLTKLPFIEEIIAQFSNTANETIEFLKKEDNQIPGDLNWIEKYDLFLEFLEDFQNINNLAYYKYCTGNLEEKKNNYYIQHLKNMDDMLIAINQCQKDLEKKLCKPKFTQKIKKWHPKRTKKSNNNGN